jgi:hypothetical protein
MENQWNASGIYQPFIQKKIFCEYKDSHDDIVKNIRDQFQYKINHC